MDNVVSIRVDLLLLSQPRPIVYKIDRASFSPRGGGQMGAMLNIQLIEDVQPSIFHRELRHCCCC